jgi:hypothetical protein
MWPGILAFMQIRDQGDDSPASFDLGSVPVSRLECHVPVLLLDLSRTILDDSRISVDVFL